MKKKQARLQMLQGTAEKGKSKESPGGTQQCSRTAMSQGEISSRSTPKAQKNDPRPRPAEHRPKDDKAKTGFALGTNSFHSAHK